MILRTLSVDPSARPSSKPRCCYPDWALLPEHKCRNLPHQKAGGREGARVEGLAEWRWGWADGIPFPAHTCCLWSSCRPLPCSRAAKTRRVVLPPLLNCSRPTHILRSMCE